jgi:hypothetical protein
LASAVRSVRVQLQPVGHAGVPLAAPLAVPSAGLAVSSQFASCAPCGETQQQKNRLVPHVRPSQTHDADASGVNADRSTANSATNQIVRKGLTALLWVTPFPDRNRFAILDCLEQAAGSLRDRGVPLSRAVASSY